MLIASIVQAIPIDYGNSFIVAPRMGHAITTQSPLVIGVICDINKRPVKNKKVVVWLNKQKIAVVTTNKHGVWSHLLQSKLPYGTHLVQASVELAAGNIAWTQGSLFYVQASRTPALCRSGNASVANSHVDYPFEDSFINTTTPLIVGSLLSSSYTPVSGETVNVKINNVTLGNATTDSNGVFSYQVSSALSETGYTVGGYCVQSSIDLTDQDFTVDVTAPAAPTIVVPAQNDTVVTSLVTISGSAEPDSTITTFMDSDTLGDISYADGSGDWSIEYELSNGAHSVTAQVSDLGQNTGSLSAARDFTVSA